MKPTQRHHQNMKPTTIRHTQRTGEPYMKRIGLATLLAAVVGGALGHLMVAGRAEASRNSSGTYSVSASGTYPFVSGTSISSSTMNSIFSDLSTEMTDSLSRSGKGGMTSPLRVPDGAVGAPTLGFTNEPTSGWYRAGAADLACSVSGTKRFEVTSTGASVTGTFGVSGAVTFTTPLATAQTDAVSTATASRLVARDANGRAAFTDPAASGDAATKGYVDARFVAAFQGAGTGGVNSQVGTVSVGYSGKSTGSYTYTAAGLTASSIVVCTPAGLAAFSTGVNLSVAGQVTVYTRDTTGALIDSAHSCAIVKL